MINPMDNQSQILHVEVNVYHINGINLTCGGALGTIEYRKATKKAMMSSLGWEYWLIVV
jgi:hypothetical protein